MLPIICEVTVAMNTNRFMSFANPEYQSELESDLELITIGLWLGANGLGYVCAFKFYRCLLNL